MIRKLIAPRPGEQGAASAVAQVPAAPAPAPRPWRQRLAGPSTPMIAVAALLVLVIVVEVFTEPTFSSPANVTNLLRATAIPAILAIGMTMVILSGGMDLSMGSILSISGIAYAKCLEAGWPEPVALVVTLGLGAAIGFGVNGILIGRFKMSFFVVTLASASAIGGIALLWSGNRQIDTSGSELASFLGNDAWGNRIPYGAVLAVVLVVVAALALKYTVFGRSVYAVGGNPEAAALSGVRREWVVPAVYGISGLCAALGGVMMAGRQTIADPAAGGSSIVLYVIAAALLSGVAIAGGAGSVYGALIGTAFLQVLSNALALKGFDNSWQMLMTGLILLLAVYFDRVRQRLAGFR
ncbi:ABC transporter permease [Amycolatopsis panacis]|uniref:ABC transporter permease n=1 Tax=Amycolatopsis panacis TaxID=2340917 RepID=A0A419HZB6_9PSEU|nr:ABC transporter permease [Amycolatopsis panacis]RJQ82476.1 ABC transporter permease [Amycolatopsis panacis]